MKAEIYFGALDLSPYFISIKRVHHTFEHDESAYFHLRFRDAEGSRANVYRLLEPCDRHIANVVFGDVLPPLYIRYRNLSIFSNPRIMAGKVYWSWKPTAGTQSNRVFEIRAWDSDTTTHHAPYNFYFEFISKGAKRHDLRTLYRANRLKSLPLRAKQADFKREADGA